MSIIPADSQPDNKISSSEQSDEVIYCNTPTDNENEVLSSSTSFGDDPCGLSEYITDPNWKSHSSLYFTGNSIEI